MGPSGPLESNKDDTVHSQEWGWWWSVCVYVCMCGVCDRRPWNKMKPQRSTVVLCSEVLGLCCYLFGKLCRPAGNPCGSVYVSERRAVGGGRIIESCTAETLMSLSNCYHNSITVHYACDSVIYTLYVLMLVVKIQEMTVVFYNCSNRKWHKVCADRCQSNHGGLLPIFKLTISFFFFFLSILYF